MAGDIMFDREIRLLGQENGYDSLFSNVASLLHGADIAVANWKDRSQPNLRRRFLRMVNDKRFSFSFATTTAMTLARSGIGFVSLANNHAGNVGRSATKKQRVGSMTPELNISAILGHDHFNRSCNRKKRHLRALVGYHAFFAGDRSG